jgi:hypothetical protein
MKLRKPHLIYPWITLFITLAIPLLTYLYNSVPGARGSSLALWITSPFNVTYELQNANGLFYNYILVVIVYLAVELYSRNMADLVGRNSLIRSAFLLSVLSSYIISAAVWFSVGFPSSGTSVIAFNLLLFAAFETYDSELINRLSERRQGMKRTLEVVSIAILALLIMVSALLFMYLNGNSFWYIHMAGGLIFAPIYLLYLNRGVRPKFDAFVEGTETGVERDLKGIIKKKEQ